MSASSDALPESRRLSNVNISPLSSDVLYVRIRNMSGEEDPPQIASSLRQISKKTVSDKSIAESDSESTVTDNREKVSTSKKTVSDKSIAESHSESTKTGNREKTSTSKKTVSDKSKAGKHSKSTKTDSREKSSASKKTVSDKSKTSNHSKYTMTDSRETASASSQTVQKEQNVLLSESHSAAESSPCLKHAAENISRKASNIPSEKISLCNNCSKSMLCYIFLVQDFLDSLAKEIIGGETPSCLQCARQETRNNIAQSDFKDERNVESTLMKHSNHKAAVGSTRHKHNDHKSSANQQKDFSRERRPSDRMFKGLNNSQVSQVKEHDQGIMNSAHQSDANDHSGPQYAPHASDQLSVENRIMHHTSHTGDNYNQQWTPGQNFNQPVGDNQGGYSSPIERASDNNGYASQSYGNDNTQHFNPYHQSNEHSGDTSEFRTLKERVQPNYQSVPTIPDNPNQNDSNNNVFESSPSLYRDDLDGIISTLSTKEREIYDSARDTAGWESLTETPERLVVPSGNLISSEAFVTSCRNNAEAIGCLVLGTSLLLCRTTRTLCVLVSEGVSTAFKNAFSAVFQVVQLVRSLDSLGTTKLALLEQPEIGVSFEKLNIWRLVQFTKCVYLNPDTLVIQNCDELFSREELSAVPDIGWPDCFNSGVFVYCPSAHTFWQLMEFAEKQGSYDGGDQGLLNSYFNSWSSDISKKMSFIYNLMANVSYTYSPAFRQFGRDVKIVQFHGSYKPWHVKFFSKTGQISPSSPVHPTYVQFVHIWLNIFRITVLRLLSQEIQSYATSQEVISAVETLRFFPLPSESESDFFLTPPSVRLRLAEKKLNMPVSSPVSEARRRKSAEFFRHAAKEDSTPEISLTEKEKIEPDFPAGEGSLPEKEKIDIPEESKAEPVVSIESTEESASDTDEEVFKESKAEGKKEKKKKDKNALPGSEIGDYQGMKAWEQGRMDYEGNASSDNIIKRLEFLMNPKPN